MAEELVPRLPAAEVAATPGEPGVPRAPEVVEVFLAGRTPRTMKAYADDLRLWSAWIHPEISVAGAVDRLLRSSSGEANRLVLGYRAFLLERGLSSATINRRLAALRSLVRLARMLGVVVWTIEVPGLPVERVRDTRGPGVPAVRRMLRAAAHQEPAKAARDIALLRLLFDLALRRGEVVALDVADLELERDALWLRRKGKRQRSLHSLPKVTRAAIEAWLEHRGSAPGPLFESFDRSHRGSGRLSGEGVYTVVRSMGERGKVGAVRPHGIRHTAITRAMEEAGRLGIPIEEVLPYSGHSKKSLPILLDYRDAIRDRQGELADRVASAIAN